MWRSILVCWLMLLLASSGSVAQPYEPDSVTIFLYHFDDSTSTMATDSGPEGLHASMFGTAWSAQGNFDGGAVFGGDDYIAVPGTALLEAEDLTLEAWVYRTADVSCLVIDASFHGLDGRRLGILETGHAYATVAVEHVGLFSATTQSPIQLNTWVHLAGVFHESARKLQIVVNGVVDREIPLMVRGRGFPYATIGRARGSSSGFFVGRIDEVRVSATARSFDLVAVKGTTWSGIKRVWR